MSEDTAAELKKCRLALWNGIIKLEEYMAYVKDLQDGDIINDQLAFGADIVLSEMKDALGADK